MLRASLLFLGPWLAVVLSGCGGGSGGVEPGSLPTEESFLPLKVGNWWTWELRTPDTPVIPGQVVPDRQTATVAGTSVIDGKEWFELQIVNWDSATGDPVGGTTSVLMRETADGVYYYYDVLRTGLKWLDKRAAVGSTWDGPAGLSIWWELVGIHDTVQAPTETFTDCWHVKEHDPVGGDSQEEVWERWFRRGVGLVLERYWGTDGEPWDDKVLLGRNVQP